jgi:hypothetical protein
MFAQLNNQPIETPLSLPQKMLQVDSNPTLSRLSTARKDCGFWLPMYQTQFEEE